MQEKEIGNNEILFIGTRDVMFIIAILFIILTVALLYHG